MSMLRNVGPACALILATARMASGQSLGELQPTEANPGVTPVEAGTGRPPPPPETYQQGQPGQQPAPGQEPKEEEGYYYTDGNYAEPQGQMRWSGQVPETHVVRRGDTLWDLCYYYFNNPWQWPKVWSYNPEITNPHWIYPGDLVRLYPSGGAPPTQPVGRQPVPNVQYSEPTRAGVVELRQLAFVSLADLKIAGTVVGSTEEKELLAQGDEIFIQYPSGKPPQVKQRYAIYSEKKAVTHPDSGSKVGAYVELVGEVEIVEVKKGKTARGVITYSTNIVERGQRVGTMKTQFKQVPPVAADRDLEGVIVGSMTTNLIGADQVVFIDRGSAEGVKVGNRFLVVRRGDAYDPRQAADWGAGRDDRRYPDDAVAQVTVIEAGKNTSVCVVSYSSQEVEIGDHVVMRKGR